jgi:hypothetical protein
MHRLTENLSPEDRRIYWKFVGGLFGFYGALLVVTVGVFLGNHLSRNLAPESASAQAAGESRAAAIEVPASIRHAAKYD